MLEKIIHFSLRNKLIIILFTVTTVIFGLFSITQIPIGALPDITNNQVQVITTSRDGDLLFRRVEVKTGRNEGGHIEILNPEVLGGHEVLVKGAFFLQ